jgi:hypothetical protein
MKRLLTTATALLLILVAPAFVDYPRWFRALAAPVSEEAGWRAAAWRFPTDAWPEGRAFHCEAAQCGAELDLYIRPKIGFCDCYRGVADDDEIDRVGDLALLSRDYVPLHPGMAVRLAGLEGRARMFLLSASGETRRHAIGIALSRRCDAIVATIVSGAPISSASEARAFELIDSVEIKDWIESLPQP